MKMLIDNSIGYFSKLLGFYYICLVLGAINIGAVGSLLKVIAFLPVFFWLTKKHTVNLTQIVVAAFFYVIWCVFSVVWSVEQNESIGRAVTQLMFLVLLVSASAYRYNNFEIDFLKKCLVWSSRITAFFVLMFGEYLYGRLYLSGIVNEDPNYLCAYFMFGIAHCLILLLANNTQKSKYLTVSELLIYFYIIFSTGSRGGLFSIIIECCVIVLLFGKSGLNRRRTIVKKILAVLLMLTAFFILIRFLDNISAERFTLETIRESNGVGRFELWEDAFNAFCNSSLIRQSIGYGTGTAATVTYLFPFHRHNVYHNMYVENLIEIGILGLFFYCNHIFSFLKNAIREKELFTIAVLCGMIMLSMSTSIYTFKPFWNIMLFTICSSLKVE